MNTMEAQGVSMARLEEQLKARGAHYATHQVRAHTHTQVCIHLHTQRHLQLFFALSHTRPHVSGKHVSVTRIASVYTCVGVGGCHADSCPHRAPHQRGAHLQHH